MYKSFEYNLGGRPLVVEIGQVSSRVKSSLGKLKVQFGFSLSRLSLQLG